MTNSIGRQFLLCVALLGLSLGTPGHLHGQIGEGIEITGTTAGSVFIGADQIHADIFFEAEIEEILSLSVDRVIVEFDSPNLDDFTLGHVDSTTPVKIGHYANVAHTIEISANDEYALGGSLDPTTKSSSDLQYLATIDGTPDSGYTSLSTTGDELDTNIAPGEYEEGQWLEVDFRMLVDLSEPIDTYTITFTITILADS